MKFKRKCLMKRKRRSVIRKSSKKKKSFPKVRQKNSKGKHFM
jgi:hypothetical protein